jgi:hypothetical protein
MLVAKYFGYGLSSSIYNRNFTVNKNFIKLFLVFLRLNKEREIKYILITLNVYLGLKKVTG